MNDIVMLKDLEKEALDLSKPSLPALAYHLRHRETWPPGFKWFFPFDSGCALQLMLRIWAVPVLPKMTERALNISEETRRSLFSLGAYDKPDRLVTPEDVADRIEALI
jgi:hypothetical protein